jgi:hypothetical protein
MGNMDVGAQTLPAPKPEPTGRIGDADPEPVVRSQGMDVVQAFLDELRQHGLAEGNFLGLIHILIGRRISRPDGTIVSPGLTWRALAEILKRLRWDKDAVREIELNPADLPPRDRQRFWYTAIAHARVDSAAAIAAGDRFAALISQRGYIVSPAPGRAAAQE